MRHVGIRAGDHVGDRAMARLSRAQLDAAALAGTLVAGEPYLITDEGRIAVGTGAGAYQAYAKVGEGADVDPYLANVVLLMHMDGEAGSSVFVDELGATVTNSGVIHASSPVLFGRSAYLGGSAHMYATHPTRYACGANDFIIEAWVTPLYVDSSRSIISGRSSSGNELAWSLGISASALAWPIFTIPSAGFSLFAQTALEVGRAYFLAVSRIGSTTRMFVDGAVVAQATASYTIPPHDRIYVGAHDVTQGSSYYGNVDELRVTVGAGRYASSYQVQSGPFPGPASSSSSSGSTYGPAFSASSTSATQSIPINTNVRLTTALVNEVYDTHNAWSSGTFTCPPGWAGIYAFCAMVTLTQVTDQSGVWVDIYRNNELALRIVASRQSGSASWGGGNSCQLNLAEGDTVDLRISITGSPTTTFGQAGLTTFSGAWQRPAP